jgi:hypothetical protein
MAKFQRDSASSSFKAVLRPALGLAREFPPFVDFILQKRAGPLAVFLPCEGRNGAALLRIYNVAEGLRARGWRALVVPPKLTLAARTRVLRYTAPDLLIMQGVRHALNRPHLYPGQRIVLDMDDADFYLPHLEGAVRRAMPQVRLVLAGSRYVANWCAAAGAGEVHVVWTGAPVSKGPLRIPQADRPPVMAWAQTRPMTYKEEAAFVREVMADLSRRVKDVRLRLYDRQAGDDPGFEAWFQAAGIRTEWHKQTQYSDYLGSLGDVALGLAPLSLQTPFSRGKSFGKVLAYLDAHVPVLASDACEHGAFFTPETGVVSNDPKIWVDQGQRLLSDPLRRAEMAERAHAAYCRQLSIGAMVAKIDPILRQLVPTAKAA